MTPFGHIGLLLSPQYITYYHNSRIPGANLWPRFFFWSISGFFLGIGLFLMVGSDFVLSFHECMILIISNRIRNPCTARASYLFLFITILTTRITGKSYCLSAEVPAFYATTTTTPRPTAAPPAAIPAFSSAEAFMESFENSINQELKQFFLFTLISLNFPLLNFYNQLIFLIQNISTHWN